MNSELFKKPKLFKIGSRSSENGPTKSTKFWSYLSDLGNTAKIPSKIDGFDWTFEDFSELPEPILKSLSFLKSSEFTAFQNVGCSALDPESIYFPVLTSLITSWSIT